MKRCPITYENIPDNERYSKRGLKQLSPRLQQLAPLSFSAEEQRKEAIARVGKMSIQGIQAKLSARLNVKNGCFEIVDQHGHYILKPASSHYAELPENEAITMSLAGLIKLDVPIHGLLYCKDDSMTYFIKRFDRSGHNKKIPTEDFAQLTGVNRDTKYNSSMEQVIKVITTFCTFPKIEYVKLFKLTLFNFLIGNEDMHLKNFSLITQDNIVALAPAYDLLNSTIVQPHAREELALPLNGKKRNLTKRDFLDYFAKERLELNQKIIDEVLQTIGEAIPIWHELISYSFLSAPMKTQYRDLLNARSLRMGL